MGQSTDAIIAFGVDFGEEPTGKFFRKLEKDFEWDFDSYIENELSIPAWSEPGRPEYGEGSDRLKCYPVELISHCSGDCPMYILAIRGTQRLARRGYPESLDLSTLSVTDAEIETFTAWCKKHGVSTKTKPQWLLFSDWN